MALISALRRQRKTDACEFYASLISMVSSKPARATYGDSVSKNNFFSNVQKS